MNNISPHVSNHPTLSKKCPNAEVFLVLIFLYSDWIRRDIRVTEIEKKYTRNWNCHHQLLPKFSQPKKSLYNNLMVLWQWNYPIFEVICHSIPWLFYHYHRDFDFVTLILLWVDIFFYYTLKKIVSDSRWTKKLWLVFLYFR